MFGCHIYLISNHFHSVFAVYWHKNNMTHIFLDETPPFWKGLNKVWTAFMCRLRNKMQTAQNLWTFAYFNAKICNTTRHLANEKTEFKISQSLNTIISINRVFNCYSNIVPREYGTYSRRCTCGT